MQSEVAGALAPESDAASAVQSGTAPVLRLGYHGTGGGLFVLVMKNLLLTVLTVGIYMPWARTERRNYLWAHIDIGGHRLRYHGTGKELLMGYLKVLGAYALFFGVPVGLGVVNKTVGVIAQVVGALAIVTVIPLAIYGSRRYLLSRTSLRNVRFGMEAGAAGGFWKVFVVGWLLTIVTLGFYAPIWGNRMQAFLTKRTLFGSEAFDYDGTDKEAFWIGIKGFFLTLLTLGLYAPWFNAAQARFHLGHTTFQGARGRTDITGGDIFKLMLVSGLGTLFTLGLAFPWITTYVTQTVLSKISFVGPVDYTRVARRASDGSAAADGFADALDVGLQL